MPFHFIKNITAQTSEECVPWESTATRPAFASKDEFRAWCNHPETDHAFISAVEGRTPGIRVSEVNPPVRMSGLVLDYDAVPPQSPELMLLTNAPTDLRPAWVSRTFSGHCRVLYKFATPVPLFTPDIAKAFLQRVQRELKLKKLLPGFEAESLLELHKYYEIGTDWTAVGDGSSTISENLLLSWLAEASRKHQWEKEGPVVPIEVIREAASAKFGADKWPGGWDKFDLGVRGPRFWDESAVDMTSVIVRESGCQYFSDGGGWMSWEAIFGTDFIRKWRDDRRGAAIAGIWFDGKNYWRKLPSGRWVATQRSDIQLDLMVDKKLTAKSVKAGMTSEVDGAIYDIQTLKDVRAAMPFLFQPDGIINFNGQRYLNVSGVQVTQPVVDHCDWGEGFPWLAQFLYTLFDPDDQLDYFLAWLKHFYVGGLTHNPTRGLALFLAGPVGVGKTILNKAILGQLLGGKQDAGQYLLGGDRFNDKLFEVALWNVDDEVLASDPKQRAQFSQMVKKIVANDSFTVRAMYKSGEDMQWVGRIVVTMNDDPESLQMLPETENNILDKIMLLKSKKPEVSYFASDAEIANELPFLGAFLRDWVVPEHCKGTPRFGVSPYKHADLLAAAGSTSQTSTFEELLYIWRKDWFTNITDLDWSGNPTALLQAMMLNESIKPILERNFPNPTAIGMHMNKLIRRGTPYVFVAGHRIYGVHRT